MLHAARATCLVQPRPGIPGLLLTALQQPGHKHAKGTLTSPKKLSHDQLWLLYICAPVPETPGACLPAWSPRGAQGTRRGTQWGWLGASPRFPQVPTTAGFLPRPPAQSQRQEPQPLSPAWVAPLLLVRRAPICRDGEGRATCSANAGWHPSSWGLM